LNCENGRRHFSGYLNRWKNGAAVSIVTARSQSTPAGALHTIRRRAGMNSDCCRAGTNSIFAVPRGWMSNVSAELTGIKKETIE